MERISYLQWQHDALQEQQDLHDIETAVIYDNLAETAQHDPSQMPRIERLRHQQAAIYTHMSELEGDRQTALEKNMAWEERQNMIYSAVGFAASQTCVGPRRQLLPGAFFPDNLPRYDTYCTGDVDNEYQRY